MSGLKPIAEQVVVVVGASSGIGRLAALRFAGEGAKVVAAARGARGLEAVVEEIRRAGGEALAVTADVAEFEQVRALAQAAVARYGRIDTWVHAAAVAIYAAFEETTPQEFKQVIDVNLLGQAYGAMAALPHLRREGRGALILITSAEAKRALPLHASYAASKHGVNAFAEALRMELQRDSVPISVTTIMPASVNTPFYNKARTKLGVKPRGIPPVYQPDVVAGAILHAAENPVRDLYAGGAGLLFVFLQKVSPRLLDALMVRFAFDGQRTDEPKSERSPNNLFESLDGDDGVYGDFGNEALPVSAYNQIKQSKGLRRGVGGLLLGAALMLLVRRIT